MSVRADLAFRDHADRSEWNLASVASIISGLRYMNRLLEDFLSSRSLLRGKECLHQFAFSTDDHFWETLEPFLARHFRLCVEPLGK